MDMGIKVRLSPHGPAVRLPLNVNEDILIVCGAFDADIVKLSALA
jgi:hypothetical protein